jgi:tetratricopeptide (TPR) repeat protein
LIDGVLAYREIASHMEARRFHAALPKLKGLLDRVKQSLGVDHPGYYMLLGVMADLQKKMGDFPGAEASAREMLHGVRRSFADHPKIWEALREMANYVGSRGDFNEAEQLYQEALRIVTRRFPPPNPRFYGPVIWLHELLGRLARDRGNYPAAETEFAVALELINAAGIPSDPAAARASSGGRAVLLLDDGRVQMELAHLDAARARLQESLELHRSLNDIGGLIEARESLVELHRLAGDYPAANEGWEPLRTELHQLCEHARQEPGLPDRGAAGAFAKLREYRPAAETMAAIVAETRRRPDAELLELPDQLLGYGSWLIRAGEGGRAIPVLQESLEIYKRMFGPDYGVVRNVLLELAKAYQLSGDNQTAEAVAREACQVREERLGRDHLWTADALSELAALLTRIEKHDEAVSVLTETLELRTSQLPPAHSLIWKNQLALAVVIRAKGDHRGAITGLREALNTQSRRLPPASYRVVEL